MIVYSRIKHAAHYDSGRKFGGHDLEQWDCADLPRSTRTGNPIRPEGVPADAQYHCGYIASGGEQRWLFTRCVPLSDFPECMACRAAAARRGR